MNHIISIIEKMGTDLRTRSFFRRDAETIILPIEGEIIFDFSGVEFISRSVADEICNLLEDYPDLSIRGMAGDVEKMYRLVVEGRCRPREYSEMNAKVVHLKNMRELSDFFCAL